MNKTDKVCFLYSSTNRIINEQIASRINGKYKPISVRVNGSWVTATAMVLESNKSNYISRYPDAKLLLTDTYENVVYVKGGIN